MTDTIEIEGMKFKAYHGCLESERRDGNLFVVDFRGELDLSVPAVSDDLHDTLDYSAIYRIAAREMATPSNLLENVAGRIADAIEQAFPALNNFSVRVSKQNPPVGGDASWARVTITRHSGLSPRQAVPTSANVCRSAPATLPG